MGEYGDIQKRQTGRMPDSLTQKRSRGEMIVPFFFNVWERKAA